MGHGAIYSWACSLFVGGRSPPGHIAGYIWDIWRIWQSSCRCSVCDDHAALKVSIAKNTFVCFKILPHFPYFLYLVSVEDFYRASYASAVLAVIVCLSVHLSVTSRSCTKMAKPVITLRTAYDSPGTLVFRCQKFWRNSNNITPTGASDRGGVGSDQRFVTNISLYLRNSAR